MQIVARSSCILLLVRGSYNRQFEFYLKINKILGNNCKKNGNREKLSVLLFPTKKKNKNRKKVVDLNEDRLDMTQKRIPTSD